jgi:alpha-ketoglutarate-dependent taurine dioxygenase
VGRYKLQTYRDDFHRRTAEASARWREHHPGAQKLAQDKFIKRNPPNLTLVRAADVAWCDAHPINYLLRGARARAKRSGTPFNITAKDFQYLPEFCPVLDELRLVYGASGKSRKLYENGAAASIDRIRNGLGYVPGNVIIVSLRANLLKGQATLDELQKIAAFYGKFR